MKQKQCTQCRKMKPVTAFYRHHERGYQGMCKACTHSPKWRAMRADHYRRKGRYRHTLKTYGLSKEGYEDLLKKQGGHCAICSSQLRLVVDHNHKTKRVRGILCDKCNVGLGKLQDSIRLLKKAINYLME